MFEKDAEEILNKHCNCEFISECIDGIRIRCSDYEDKKKLLLEGIEFGYNRALENRNCSNCRRSKTECPNDGSCHNFSLWQPFKNPEL